LELTKAPEHHQPLVVLALFAALSIAWTWPLGTQIATRIAFDPGDPFLNAWILWWNAQAMPFTEAWWNPPIFYPMRGALALSEHLAGIGLFTTPLIRLGGSVPLAYNVALLLSYALSGFFTYLLVRRLGGSTIAAFCAGLAYGFAPFRAGQLSHLQVLTSQWLPLQLLGLHGYIDTGRGRWLIVFGAAWTLQGLSNGYYLLFAPALIGAWLCWFVVARRRWRQAAAVLAAGAIASVPLAMVLLKYREVHTALGLGRSAAEIQRFSGNLGSFLNPPFMLAVWPQRPVPTVEDWLFPGATIVVVILTAAVVLGVRRTKHAGELRLDPFVFYVCAAALMAALTLGPAPPEAGLAGWLRPYQWLVQLPGFSGLRVPVRFGMLMALCLAVAGGLGLAMILPSARRPRVLAGAIVAAGIGVDGLMKPLPFSPPPGRVELPSVPAATVLELPPDDASVSVGAMFRSMAHRRPLINGYSGHIPPHYDILCQSLRRRDPSVVIELARGRTLLILIAERKDPGGDFRRLIESIPGVERLGVTGGGMSYVLRAQPASRRPSGGTRHAFTSTFLPRAHVVLDLGSQKVVRTLEFPLRDRYSALGRRIAVEISDNGTAWTTALEDWTGGAAITGALEDQIAVPVRLVLPDVTGRYLRIHPAEDWLINELEVKGP
jgi:hypothetical protein